MMLATLLMQFVLLALVGWSAWQATKVLDATDKTLQAVREYRRELGWLTERIDALEIKVKNGMVETGRGK